MSRLTQSERIAAENLFSNTVTESPNQSTMDVMGYANQFAAMDLHTPLPAAQIPEELPPHSVIENELTNDIPGSLPEYNAIN